MHVVTQDFIAYVASGVATGLILAAFRYMPQLRRRLRRRDQLEDVIIGRIAAPGIPAVPGLGERIDTAAATLAELYDYSHAWRHDQSQEITKLVMTVHLLIGILTGSPALDDPTKSALRQLPELTPARP